MAKKNIDYFEEFLKDLPESFKKWHAAEENLLQKVIQNDSKVLAVACGDGREINYVAKVTRNVVGLDQDKTAVEHARNNLKKFPELKIILGDAADLPFEEDSFDFVICMGSITNFGPIKERALLEMKRVVKKNGKIVLSVYSEDALPERMKIYKKFDKLYNGIIDVREDGTVIFEDSLGANISEQFTGAQLRALFDGVGLKVVEITKVGIGYNCVLEKV